jgi:lariat debranching enzyme
LRDESDLEALECPPKYKELGEFHRFYKREKVAPILTIFIGGNHEASNYLRDLYYGGWVSENIYYLGCSGVIDIKKGDHSIKIGGLSGIDKKYDMFKGYFEEWPYTHSHDYLRSIYHIREFDIQKMKLVIVYSIIKNRWGKVNWIS